MHDPPPVPSGWFPDPLGRFDHRYFNGSTWTSDVSRNGQRAVDPLGITPTGPGGAPGGDNKNGAATAAVVMGSVGLAIAWIPFVVVAGAVLAVLAIVFGVRGLRRAKQVDLGRGASIAGIVMGSVGIGASIVGIVLSVSVWNEVVSFVEPGDHTLSDVACDIDARQVEVTGSIVNDTDDARGYVIFVEVDDVIGFTVVDDVPGGAASPWAARVVTRAPLDDCNPEIAVHGPFPYGLEVDAVNDPRSP